MKNSVKVRAGLVTILLAALVSCKGNDTMGKGTDAEGVNEGAYSDTTTVVPMNDSLTSPGNNGGMNNNGTGSGSGGTGTGSGTNGNGTGSSGTGTNQSGTGTNKSGTNNNGAGVSGEGSTGTTNTNPRP